MKASETSLGVRSQSQAMIDGWFKDHVATYSEGLVGGVRVERLVWQKPGTNCYRVDYVCIGGTTLCVAGDIGEAVYNTGAESMEWWARCDLDYFAAKCYASEYGRGYKDWDIDLAEARLRDEVRRRRDDGQTVEDDDVESAVSAIRDGRSEWEHWMREHAHRVFGDDWWDFAPKFGTTIALRCAGHLKGLQLALRSLKASAGVHAMKVLTVQQPWAWLIVNGFKDIENRTWPTKIRGEVAIHASQKYDEWADTWLRRNFPHIPLPPREAIERGGVVGVATITDCVKRHSSPWFQGTYGFVLTKAQPVPFIPMRGHLGFFDADLSQLVSPDPVSTAALAEPVPAAEADRLQSKADGR